MWELVEAFLKIIVIALGSIVTIFLVVFIALLIRAIVEEFKK